MLSSRARSSSATIRSMRYLPKTWRRWRPRCCGIRKAKGARTWACITSSAVCRPTRMAICASGGDFKQRLPNSPLTYDGALIRIRWCVRVRAMLRQGKQCCHEHPFRLGARRQSLGVVGMNSAGPGRDRLVVVPTGERVQSVRHAFYSTRTRGRIDFRREFRPSDWSIGWNVRGWHGQIVGPHGSGKSTLLETLLPAGGTARPRTCFATGSTTASGACPRPPSGSCRLEPRRDAGRRRLRTTLLVVALATPVRMPSRWLRIADHHASTPAPLAAAVSDPDERARCWSNWLRNWPAACRRPIRPTAGQVRQAFDQQAGNLPRSLAAACTMCTR